MNFDTETKTDFLREVGWNLIDPNADPKDFSWAPVHRMIPGRAGAIGELPTEGAFKSECVRRAQDLGWNVLNQNAPFAEILCSPVGGRQELGDPPYVDCKSLGDVMIGEEVLPAPHVS